MNARKLRVHFLQHVSFEALGSISEWIETKGHELSKTYFKESEELPKHSDYDLLIIMGGPMSIYDEERFPWLKKEKDFIRDAVTQGKHVIGICLGAQLIADSFGSPVRKMDKKEIGWFPLFKTNGKNTIINHFPDKFTCFHWHGEMFDIPDGAEKLFESKGCENQGFIFKNALAFQFHLEMTEDAIERMIEKGSDELIKDTYVNSPEELKNGLSNLALNKDILFELLNKIEGRIIN